MDFRISGKRVLHVQVKENRLLSELKSKTEKHFMEKIGDAIKKDDRPFHPHITIANRDMKPPILKKHGNTFQPKNLRNHLIYNSISLLKLSQVNGM